MGSTFTTFPDKFDQQFLGKKKKLPVYIQFVPGIVTDNITGEDSLGGADLNKIGSIRALPHFGDKGIKKKSAMDETYRYWPLLRGIQEVPTPGDPVLLCTMGGVNYYMGPLNTEGSPNWNNDKFNNNEIKSGFELAADPRGSNETPLFKKELANRLEKRLNSALDSPTKGDSKSPWVSNVVHGDMVFEGRHGNSLRIGSRHKNPYLIISNGRPLTNPVETTLDGTILAVLNYGSISEHFSLDYAPKTTTKKRGRRAGQTETKTKKYSFTLADEEVSYTMKKPGGGFGRPETAGAGRCILQTASTPLGSGRAADAEDDMDGAKKTIYEYNGDQFFLSSDRLTFNARKESIFLSAFKHIRVGCGSSMTFSTSKNILTEAAESVLTNTPLFKVNATGAAYLDGRERIVLGNPILGDHCERAVLGEGTVNQFVLLIEEIKNICWAVSEAIENAAEGGGSVDIMNERVDSLDELIGMDVFEDEFLGTSYDYPMNIKNMILSDKVFIKK